MQDRGGDKGGEGSLGRNPIGCLTAAQPHPHCPIPERLQQEAQTLHTLELSHIWKNCYKD